MQFLSNNFPSVFDICMSSANCRTREVAKSSNDEIFHRKVVLKHWFSTEVHVVPRALYKNFYGQRKQDIKLWVHDSI